MGLTVSDASVPAWLQTNIGNRYHRASFWQSDSEPDAVGRVLRRKADTIWSVIRTLHSLIHPAQH
ncbi:MAG: hypothetical protein CBB71_02765 [Rhodopirellula sp. TMED11]|nr:MAG: hypothetical protein CBB71_02765 [Rhodopirellula sp. TMED11]